MTFLESLLVASLAIALATPVALGFVRRDRTAFWSPLMMCSAVYCFYFLIGPLVAILTGRTTVVFEEARHLYHLGWIAGIVGFVGISLGFAVPVGNARSPAVFLAPPDAALVTIVARCCLALGFFGVGVSFLGSSTGFGGGLGNYVFSLYNFLAIYFGLTFWLHRGRSLLSVAWVSVPLGLLLLLLVSVGFRGPIVITGISVVSYWYLVRRSRPSFVVCLLAVVGVVAFAGVMVLTRSYFSGLDFSRLEGLSFWDVMTEGLGDSATFGALCVVIDKVPALFPFAYGEMLWVTATFPIPRAVWPGKPVAEYLHTIQRCVAGENLDQGMAVPHIGEYYLAFGWPGIALGSFVVGLGCRWMWNWYRRSPNNPLVIATYGSFFAWLFQLIHRGYLPSAISAFCFSVLPGILLAHWFSRRARGRRPLRPAAASAISSGSAAG